MLLFFKCKKYFSLHNFFRDLMGNSGKILFCSRTNISDTLI